MKAQLQLLCTFCSENTLSDTIKKIVNSYEIALGSIYILENVDNPGNFCCTYNISTAVNDLGTMPESTISLHRKKSTNTLYTINALNMLVAQLNGGTIDASYKVPWENYRNCILVTAYGKLKKIPTRLKKIIQVNELGQIEEEI